MLNFYWISDKIGIEQKPIFDKFNIILYKDSSSKILVSKKDVSIFRHGDFRIGIKMIFLRKF